MIDERKPQVIVVTGLSGAGRSTALHALEDMGFFCIDNLPPVLAPEAVALCERGGMLRIALGVDVRVRAFLGEIGKVLSLLAAPNDAGVNLREVQVLFLDASDEALLRRFGETRRPHPMASADADGAIAVLDGVRLERERLAPLRAHVDHLIDTTRLSVHELRRTVLDRFGPAAGGALRMSTRIVSFGFKYGTPVDADLVLDVRFMQNPHFVPELRALVGTDAPVSKYVLSHPDTAEFLEKTMALLAYVLPRYEREGKSYLTIAVGCTGGQHRSVAIAAELGKRLGAERSVTVQHRDIGRRSEGAAAAGSDPDLGKGTT